jgi:hypothetical protein
MARISPAEREAAEAARRQRIIAALPPYHRTLAEVVGLSRVAVTHRKVYAAAKAKAAQEGSAP